MNITAGKGGASGAAIAPSSSARRFPAGKLLISAAALFPAVGAFVADWNDTHVFNPKWPPHAKFHNAQTITEGAELAALSLWQLWGPGEDTAARVRWATLLGGLYWLTAAPAILFPGAAFTDPDNPTQPTTLGPIPVNQVTLQAAVLLPLLAAGYALQTRRLRRASAGR